MDSRLPGQADIEVDVSALLSSLARKLPLILLLVGLAAVGTFFGLAQLAPVYKSQATILIAAGESELTRNTPGADGVLDQEAIASQVQLIRSRDVAQTVAAQLDLGGRAEFDETLAELSQVSSFLVRYGLASQPSESTAEERVLDAYYGRLTVYPVERSRVIAVDFSSTDPQLAADAANAIAESYIALQRDVKRGATTDATEFLSTQIVELRAQVVEAEARVESFRSQHGLFSGGQTATTLPEQQLADLNGELSRVRAGRADAGAKAAQIRASLSAGSALNLAEVVNSQLIQRLIEQQVAVKSQIAQLSASLLPQHPRMRELSAQVADFDRQIAVEAGKILASVESEAELAAAREDEIVRGLDELKAAATRANDAGVQLRALEREAAAQRDLLDSYLRSYREAVAREQTDYLPVDARIVSRAAVPISPDFPKKVPMTAAATAAMLILTIAFLLLRELASGRPMRPISFATAVPTQTSASARPAQTPHRWPDGAGVHRIIPNEPALALASTLLDTVEESLADIAGEIIDRGAKRILVTLAEDSQTNGRPLAAVSLARALTRTDARVVAIDFRGDEVNSVSIGQGADLPGFSDLLENKASFAQVIFRDRRSRVHFIPAGHDPVSSESLAVPRLETILSALTLTYDYVILDARDDLIPTLAPSCPVAVVVSEFGASDPRTLEAFARIESVAEPIILLLVVDPAATADDGMAGDVRERGREIAPAGEAA